MKASGAAVGVLCYAALCIACADSSRKAPRAADLAADLRQSDPTIRRRALESICRLAGETNREEALATLRPVLKEVARNREDPLRAVVLDAWLCAGVDDEAELQRMVQDRAESVGVRMKAIQELPPTSTDAERILTEVSNDPAAPPQLRITAVRNLGRGCPSAAPALERLLDSDEPLVRIEAIEALIQLGDALSLRRALSHTNAAVQNAAIRALPRLGASGVPMLVERLKSTIAGIRAEAATDLGRLRWAAVLAAPALRDAARDADARVRAAADRSLREIGPSLSELAKELNSADPSARRRALAGMHLAAKEVGPGAAELVPHLRKALRDPALDVRAEAPRVLALIGAPAAEAVPDLLNLLSEDTPLVRERAVAVLDELWVSVEDPAIKTALKESLARARQDPNAGVRGWAETGFARLTREPRRNHCAKDQ